MGCSEAGPRWFKLGGGIVMASCGMIGSLAYGLMDARLGVWGPGVCGDGGSGRVEFVARGAGVPEVPNGLLSIVQILPKKKYTLKKWCLGRSNGAMLLQCCYMEKLHAEHRHLTDRTSR